MVRIPIHTGPGRVSQAFSGPQVHAGVMCSGGACPDRLCSTLRGVKIVFQAHMSGVSVFCLRCWRLGGFYSRDISVVSKQMTGVMVVAGTAWWGLVIKQKIWCSIIIIIILLTWGSDIIYGVFRDPCLYLGWASLCKEERLTQRSAHLDMIMQPLQHHSLQLLPWFSSWLLVYRSGLMMHAYKIHKLTLNIQRLIHCALWNENYFRFS